MVFIWRFWRSVRVLAQSWWACTTAELSVRLQTRCTGRQGDGFDLLDCLGFELVHFFDSRGPRASGSGSFFSWHSSGLPMLEHDQGLVVEIKHYADDSTADGDVGGDERDKHRVT
jgi:hypothetical protein